MTLFLALFPLVFVLPNASVAPFSRPRDAALALSLPVSVAFWGLSGGGVYIDPGVFFLVATLLSLLTLATVLSDRPAISIRGLIRFAAAVALGLAATRSALTAVVMGGVVHAVFVVCQRRWPATWATIDRRIYSAEGLAGNTNFSGAFLAPVVFVAIADGDFLAVPLLVYALTLSRCRGAFVGAVAGAFVVNPWAGAAAAAGAIVYAVKTGRTGSSYRLDVWRSAIRRIGIRNAFVGEGVGVSKIRSSLIKRGVRFRWAHSDAIQLALDAGIPAAIILQTIGAWSAFAAYQSGAPFLSAAIVCLMVSGLFLNTQSIALTMVVFWVVVGQAGQASGVVYAAPSWWPVAAVFLAAIAAATWGRSFVADVVFGAGFGRHRSAVAAHVVNPDDSKIAYYLITGLVNGGRHDVAFLKATRLADKYDGEVDIETVLWLLGATAANAGAYGIARTELSRLLEYNPAAGGAAELLSKLPGATN